MQEAADSGWEDLKILRDCYAGKGKPRIVSLYTQLILLHKLTEYVMQAENMITVLRNTGEALNDGLTIAMVLKGMSGSFSVVCWECGMLILKELSVGVVAREGTRQDNVYMVNRSLARPSLWGLERKRFTRKEIVVDTGATSHIISDLVKIGALITDPNPNPGANCGWLMAQCAKESRSAGVSLIDRKVQHCCATLELALYIPSLFQRHLHCESCNFQRSNSVLQGRRKHTAAQRRYTLSHSRTE